MKSLDLTKPITTESLLKEFESRFNMTMDLTTFNEVELQDYANHVRTKIHEITQNTHFGQELKDDSYQKNQMMLDIINQAINERKLGEYGGNTEKNPVLDKATAPIRDKLKKGQALSPDEREAASKLMASKTNEVVPVIGIDSCKLVVVLVVSFTPNFLYMLAIFISVYLLSHMRGGITPAIHCISMRSNNGLSSIAIS